MCHNWGQEGRRWPVGFSSWSALPIFPLFLLKVRFKCPIHFISSLYEWAHMLWTHWFFWQLQAHNSFCVKFGTADGGRCASNLLGEVSQCGEAPRDPNKWEKNLSWKGSRDSFPFMRDEQVLPISETEGKDAKLEQDPEVGEPALSLYRTHTTASNWGKCCDFCLFAELPHFTAQVYPSLLFLQCVQLTGMLL